MKYYTTADVHGLYTEFHKALDEAGYFTDPEPHKLIILGDIFDREKDKSGDAYRYFMVFKNRNFGNAGAYILDDFVRVMREL